MKATEWVLISFGVLVLEEKRTRKERGGNRDRIPTQRPHTSATTVAKTVMPRLGSWAHGSYNFRQTKFKDFSRRKTSFQGPMFIQYIDIFVPFFTPKTLNSVITYFRFSNSSALVDEVSLCNVMHLSMLSPSGGGGTRAYVGHLTFQKNFWSKSPPWGPKIGSNQIKYPHLFHPFILKISSEK